MHIKNTKFNIVFRQPICFGLANLVLLIIISNFLWSCVFNSVGSEIPVIMYKQYIINQLQNREGKEGSEQKQNEIIQKYEILAQSDIRKYLLTKTYIFEERDVFYDLQQFDQRNGGDCDDFQLQQQRLLLQLGYKVQYQVYFRQDYQHQICLFEENGRIMYYSNQNYLNQNQSTFEEQMNMICQLNSNLYSGVFRYIIVTHEELIEILQK